MAKPTEVKLKKKEQTAVKKMWEKMPNARSIAESLSLPRHQVMFFCEQMGFTSYSEGSYL